MTWIIWLHFLIGGKWNLTRRTFQHHCKGINLRFKHHDSWTEAGDPAANASVLLGPGNIQRRKIYKKRKKGQASCLPIVSKYTFFFFCLCTAFLNVLPLLSPSSSQLVITTSMLCYPHILVLILYTQSTLFLVLDASQLSPEDLAQVPANSTSNILNRLMVSYDPRIRPNFQGNTTNHRVLYRTSLYV